MKRTCIIICSLLVYGLSYAVNLQTMSCSGSSTVTGPLGATTVTGYGTTVPTGSGNVTCNACYYAGHLYVGNSLIDWSDTFSANGVQRIMYSDELAVYPGSILNNRFTWGNDMSETFNIVNSVGWTLDNTVTPNIYWKVFAPSATNIKYMESGAGKGMSLNTVGASAVPSDRNIAGYAVTFDAASHTYVTSPEVVGGLDHHIQCSFVYPRWCGDGVLDTDKSEQCDNGSLNGTTGNACSATCQNISTPTLSCNNLTISSSPAQLTSNGGTITATCTATNATQYKFVLKQNGTEITTKPYQESNQTTFTLPANTDTNSKNYTVNCYVSSATQSEIDGPNCNKGITVPGTEPSVCNSLTLSRTTAEVNVPIRYICSATNATSYIIKQGTTTIGTLPESTFSLSTPGTYTIGCYIDGKTDTPEVCKKQITITNPPVSTIPSIFIDKDDSTPGTPDSDGNDIQRVLSNGTATFTVLVRNNGNEALKTVSIEDPLAPDCARTAAQTVALYSGGASTNFDVGEIFTYQCSRNSVINTTFPNNRNIATVKGVGVTSSTNVTDSDITEIFMKQVNPNITVEKDDDDNADDEQEVDEGGTANFSIIVTNNGTEALDTVILVDDLSPGCDRDESETRAMIRQIGNDDALFDPGETFTYSCEEKRVTDNTFPDQKNTVCVSALGVDTNQQVDKCDDTNIILVAVDEPSMCENIDSSEGAFGGAPFRTNITCNTTNPTSTCQIEVSRDGEIVNTYDDCSQNITFATPGEYAVACIVDDIAAPECEMGITVEAMTDVPTGTKTLIIILLSLVIAGYITYFMQKRKLS